MRKYVYYLRPIGIDGPIKVGCSLSVEERIKQIRLWSPYELELIYFCEASPIVERALHGRYRKHRKHGEWFHYEGLVKADVDRLMSGEALSDVVGFDLGSGRTERRVRKTPRSEGSPSSELLKQIEEFLSETGMGPVYFGKACMNNSEMIARLRRGGRVWPETEAKVRAFLKTRRKMLEAAE